MKIRIHVTREVIARAMWCGTEHNGDRPSDTTMNCAVSLAGRQLFPLSETGCTTFAFYGAADNWKRYVQLPTKAMRWISIFDRLKDKPERRVKWLPELSFEIEVPASVIDAIGIDEVHRVLSESKTLELVSEAATPEKQ